MLMPADQSILIACLKNIYPYTLEKYLQRTVGWSKILLLCKVMGIVDLAGKISKKFGTREGA